ncbi:MAG: hypothetical protein ACR2MT_02895 [Aurantibacter sp.]
MKTCKKNILLLAVGLALTLSTTFAQDPSAPVWGVYASGLGEPLKVGMDPCQVTYTVAFMSDPNIVANLGYGTMGAVGTSLTWNEASALRRTYGRYFDDEPDGTYKLTPCELPPFSASGTFNTQYGPITLRHSGGSISGTYYEGKATVSGSLNGLVLTGTWTQTNGSGDFVFTFSSDGSSFDGKWRSKNGTTWSENWDGARVGN